jgi:hypothetical protein
MTTRPVDPNRALLERAAELLRPIIDELVFVGGCATGLLITDVASAGIRPTDDIDVIVEVGSYAQYAEVSDRLRALGFREDAQSGVICRWRYGDDLILDVMPTDEQVLGFANRWFGPAIASARAVSLGAGQIRAIAPVYFLATKLEAFHGRGRSDFMASHDLEDVVTVIDGRPEVIAEVQAADSLVRGYLSTEFRQLLEERRFVDALNGFLQFDAANQQRVPLVLRRIRSLAAASNATLVVGQLQDRLDGAAQSLLRKAAAAGILITGGTARDLSAILIEAFESASENLIAAYADVGERDLRALVDAVSGHLSQQLDRFRSETARPLRSLEIASREIERSGRAFLESLPDRVAAALSKRR